MPVICDINVVQHKQAQRDIHHYATILVTIVARPFARQLSLHLELVDPCILLLANNTDDLVQWNRHLILLESPERVEHLHGLFNTSKCM
jgi:hypothetical protein